MLNIPTCRKTCRVRHILRHADSAGLRIFGQFRWPPPSYRPAILRALLAGCCPTAPPHVCVEINQRTFTVGRIVDGDTFKVQYDGEEVSVRFVGINAPERNAPSGTP